MSQSTPKELDKLTFDFEAAVDKDVAIYSLYAGLRMFFDSKKNSPKDKLSIAAGEAYCRLQEMKEQYPVRFQECEEEYNEVYKDRFFIDAPNVEKEDSFLSPLTTSDLLKPIHLNAPIIDYLLREFGYTFGESEQIEPLKVICKVIIDQALNIGNATRVSELRTYRNDLNEEMGCRISFLGPLKTVTAGVVGEFGGYFVERRTIRGRGFERVQVSAKLVRKIDMVLNLMEFYPN